MDREPTQILAAMRSPSKRTSTVGGRSPTLQQVAKLLLAVTRKPIRSHGCKVVCKDSALGCRPELRAQQLKHPARVS